MRKSIFFYKELSPAEAGNTGTHEKYIRLTNDFDYRTFFQEDGEVNGSVRQIVFQAKDKSEGHEGDDPITFKFVYYENSNGEKRIPSLGPLYSSHNIQENDVVVLESRTTNGNTEFYFYHYKANEVTIKPNTIYYTERIVDKKEVNAVIKSDASLQQIFYGAPGTGKSHTIKEQTEGKDVIRTTFHPDTDYSTFVGAYKPTTKSFPVTTVIGTKAVAVEDKNGKDMYEDKIVYEFVPQAFLQAYVNAWTKFNGIADVALADCQYLVIEEINRGNCAQIFGDLFQLLDRGDGGFSEYPIKADADMKRYLQKAMKDVRLDDVADIINTMYNGEDIAKQVLNGDILLLPNNLFIWATMNTSDQSLFPIDSAFKRRWDWQYVPISDAGEGWVIRVNGNDYSWWNFLEEINKRIYKATYSEDKKLGYFFCKANDGVIDADRFVSKVVFYLWNDVFKDMEFEGDAFKDGEKGKLSFDKFYSVESNKTKVVTDKVELFLQNLGLESVEIPTADDKTKVDTKIQVNGINIDKVNAIPYTAIEEYIKLHPGKTAKEVADTWRGFKKYSMRSWIIATKEELASIPERYANYSYSISCADGESVWVNKDGWMHHPKNTALRDTIKEFIDAVNSSDLGITITENID